MQNRKIGDRLSVKLTDGRGIEIAYIGDDESGLHCWRFLSALFEGQMNIESTAMDGWGDCDLRKYLNDKTIKSLLPKDLQSIICKHKVKYNTVGNGIRVSEDFLWLPSVEELNGKTFPFFDNWRNRLIGDNEDRHNTEQWTRTVYCGNRYVSLNVAGGMDYSIPWCPLGVAPCFATNIEL